MRNSKILSAFLDAVNISALAVMLVVGIKLGVEVMVDWKPILIALLTVLAFLRYRKMNSACVVVGGAMLGYLLTWVSGGGL